MMKVHQIPCNNCKSIDEKEIIDKNIVKLMALNLHQSSCTIIADPKYEDILDDNKDLMGYLFLGNNITLNSVPEKVDEWLQYLRLLNDISLDSVQFTYLFE